MHKGLKFLGMGCVCLFSVSCTITYGNKDITDAGKLASLKPGEATVNDVYEKLGQPSDVQRTPCNASHWIYRYRAAKGDILSHVPMGVGLVFGGKNGDVYRKDFLFDTSDRLTKVERNQKELYTSNLFSVGRTVKGYVNPESDSSKRVNEEMKRIGKKFDKGQSSEDQLLEKAL